MDSWEETLQYLSSKVSTSNFNAWLSSLSFLGTENNKALLGVENPFVLTLVRNKFGSLILEGIKKTVPGVEQIEFKVIPSKRKTINKQKPKDEFQEKLNFNKNFQQTGLDSKFGFDNYIVGSFNELAFATSQSIIKDPGHAYNPFFVYGNVGIGKTHLIQAIGNYLFAKDISKLLYTNAPNLTTEIINAIRANSVNDLINKYLQYEVLIIDDIEFIAGKEKTQEVFFNIFNNLHQKNHQIILTSDRPPKAIELLEARLRSRFEGGMIADIGMPDYETRVVILKEKLKEKKAFLSDTIINYISQNIKTNIRELEGVLNQALAFCSIKQRSDEEVISQLEKIIEKPKSNINFDKILSVVCDYFKLNSQDLLSTKRTQTLVRPRQIIMYLTREELNMSYPAIAVKLNKNDHTTIIYSVKKIEKQIKEDKDLRETIAFIRERVENY